jgi:D-alanine-D-alanine ligase
MSTPKPLKISVLHGGPSSEHDISVWSSKGVVATLRRAGHAVRAVFVDKTGLWHVGQGQEDAGTPVAQPLSCMQGVEAVRDLGADVCFMGFHGTYGEDGKVQALLELAGMAYTGSGVLASALAMAKPMTRKVFESIGIPVATAVELQAQEIAQDGGPARTAAHVAGVIGLPAVVKVPAGGSSVGVEIARDEASLADTLRRLAVGTEMLLCEQFVAGTELTAGVIEDEFGRPLALPIVEIVPKSALFFDYEAKYKTGGSDEIVPARIPADAATAVQRIGVAAHVALGCRGVSRTDVILGHDGKPVALETNTLPGLTPASLLPKAAAAAGLSYADLLHRIIGSALRSHP